MKAAEKEYVVLKEQYEEVENLMNSRADINRQFAQINQYFRDIGQGMRICQLSPENGCFRMKLPKVRAISVE
ncbi:hypothetical protein KUH03_00940 [Sphingobacterium sp. E70]|uniref:hypothetical protein n=1 Tax=Sphingobacterium sp. E70 TaxID=2853439 RepID=UPI00211BF320|nr:hypothetical protein [Sphingobacterium sp. E70]ULT25609.1 hypothetical protein KUH03_00940 [Sphingobacterium sp. E70]